MERESQFQIPLPLHSGGESQYAAETSVGEAYINGVYDGLSFRSLLTYDPYVSSHPATYGFFNLPAQTQNILTVPKTELLNNELQFFTFNNAVSSEAPPFNFFSGAASSSHHQLPDLLSLELPKNTAVESLSRVENRQRRRKQQRLSDKTRCLQKLLPWEKKMDMATILEEAYKYIKFLQAQVSILQSMPNCESGSNSTTTDLSYESRIVVGDHLGRLDRQQLLQVLLNSPMAQTVLYSRGCCVYSLEQLILLKKNAERKALFQHMLFDHDSNPNSSFLS